MMADKGSFHELSSVSSVGTSATLTFQCCSCGAGMQQSCSGPQIAHFIGRHLECKCGVIARTNDAEFLQRRR